MQPQGQPFRRVRGDLTERREHGRQPVHGPHQLAAVDLAGREQPDPHRRDDPEVAATTAQRPEQFGVAGRGDLPDPAHPVDQLDRLDRVGGLTVPAAEPAHPAAQRHAHDRRVGAAAGQEGQPGPGQRGQQLAGLDPGADRRGPRGQVDLDAAQRPGPQQQHLVQVVTGAVADRLRGDLPVVVRRPAHRVADVLGVGHLDHGQRRLLHHHVPGPPDLVPAVVAGPVHPARHHPAQVIEAVRGARRVLLGVHRSSSRLSDLLRRASAGPPTCGFPLGLPARLPAGLPPANRSASAAARRPHGRLPIPAHRAAAARAYRAATPFSPSAASPSAMK